VRARGGDVRIVYSPLDATRIAADNPDKQVVFFGVGFETTAPANAMSVLHAKRLGLTNFSMLVSHVLVPPAMTAILRAPVNRVQGFLAAGHVCSVMGTGEYAPLVQEFGVPIVVTGFEPLDVLEGVRQVVELLEAGKSELRNAYPRAVTDAGNTVAQQALEDVFVVTDRQWRGIGMIPQSGWTLSPRYAEFDAELKFGVGHLQVQESAECHSGEVLQGLIKPNQCPAFGTTCTPRTPLGATMVSSEGACAAYYQFRRLETASRV
jgi:hydrogenase expression/formation protein HypD